MPSVVFDASSLVGALLKPDSIPERAFMLARAQAMIALSDAVEAEIRAVFARPKFAAYLPPGRAERFLDLLAAGALRVTPGITVTACRDAKDNKYLELALAAGAATIVTSDADPLVLNPFRGVEIVTPAEFVRRQDARKTP